MATAAPLRFETSRLLLRQWQESDLEPFAKMNADPEVMRYYLSPLTRAETESMVSRNNRHFAERAFGLWAAEVKETGGFAGYIGLAVPSFEAYFTPCVEIGWRLAKEYWNRGLATEGAAAVLRFAHEIRGLREVVSFTTQGNFSSRRVMEKIGMRRDPFGDFDHPQIPEEHPLCRHVLYRAQLAVE